jgi:D-psicose/D-tagatose/L-ribulose 3-epimerase
MNPIGANTWIWVSPLTDERLALLAPRIRDWGFDVIEMPIENPGDWDPGRAAELLSGLGLRATLCAVMPEDRDLSTSDSETVHRTQDYLRTCVDHAARVGAGVVAGPMYGPVGRARYLDRGERAATIARIVENLRPVAEYAASRDVRLGIEPLNRYETSLVNLLRQAVEIADAVGGPGIGVAADTFHMNIEEKDMAAALREAGPWLAHVQVCGNDRGAPGDDHIDWPAVAQALGQAGYDRPICIESFTSENRTIARAASIWRPLATSQDELATRGLAFLRATFGAAA